MGALKTEKAGHAENPVLLQFLFLEYKMVLNSILVNKLLIQSLSKHINLMLISARHCSVYWDYIIEQKEQSVLSWSLHFTRGDGHRDK